MRTSLFFMKIRNKRESWGVMTTKKMTVEQAIDMRDSLKRKIKNKMKTLNSSCMVVEKAEYNKDTYNKIEEIVRSTYQSVSTMVLNYDILSSAIMQSNHSTTISGIKGQSGRNITIAEALAVLNSPTGELVEILRRSRQIAYSTSASTKGTMVIDVLGDKAIKYVDSYDNYVETLKNAIKESNRKNIITVNLQD